MAYIVNADGTFVNVPNNSALPAGARWAEAEEAEQWEQAERIRAAAGIPAPKSAQQAKLEHDALEENIRNRGGLATPQELANLALTAEQMNQPSTPAESQPTVTSRGRNATVKDADGPPIVLGRGATAGDQYTQYETVPSLAKVVTDETPVTDEAKSSRSAKVAPVGNADNVTSRAPIADIASSEPPLPEGKRDLPNSTPEERAKNSPTAKSKEK